MTNKQINESFLPSKPNGEVPKTFGLRRLRVMVNAENVPVDDPLIDFPDSEFHCNAVIRTAVYLLPSEAVRKVTDGEGVILDLTFP